MDLSLIDVRSISRIRFRFLLEDGVRPWLLVKPKMRFLPTIDLRRDTPPLDGTRGILVRSLFQVTSYGLFFRTPYIFNRRHHKKSRYGVLKFCG